MKKAKKKVKVVKVHTVAPKVHEVVLHVEADEPPPPLDPVEEILTPRWPLEAVSGVDAIAERTPAPEAPEGKRSFWNWLFGD